MSGTVDATTFAPLEGTDPALPGDPFSRPRYMYGQLLGAEDFTSEQTYHLLRARMRNALLHGSGVVNGLAIASVTTDNPPAAELICSPGLAIDQLGREIYVPEKICLDVTGLANNQTFWRDLRPPPGATTNDPTRRCYAVLTYRACLSAQVPAIAPPCSDADNSLDWSRVLDSYRLCLEAAAPPDPHPLSRDWLALKPPPPDLRSRLQELLTGKPANPAQLWSLQQDAKLLLAIVDLRPVGNAAATTSVAAIDPTVRALLPDVQTVAQIATGVRLIGPSTTGFTVLDVAATASTDAGNVQITATLSADVVAGTVTDTSARLFKLNAGAWTQLTPVRLDATGSAITITVHDSWAAGTVYQLALSGSGAQPILDAQNRPLAGFADEPSPPPGRGRDACRTATFTP